MRMRSIIIYAHEHGTDPGELWLRHGCRRDPDAKLPGFETELGLKT